MSKPPPALTKRMASSSARMPMLPMFFGAHDGDWTHLNLIDSQVISPEIYVCIKLGAG